MHDIASFENTAKEKKYEIDVATKDGI